MSSYDPESHRQMKPKNWLQSWVASIAPSHAQIQANIIEEATFQAQQAANRRYQLSLQRKAPDANWIFTGGVPGPKDAYIEEELSQKRAAAASAQN